MRAASRQRSAWVWLVLGLAMISCGVSHGASSELQTLLDSVRADARQQSAQQSERERAFVRRKQEQQALLAQAQRQVQQAQREVEALRQTIAAQGRKIEAQEQALEERSGDLQSVAAVLRDGATTALEQFNNSLVTLDDRERLARITALTQVAEVPSSEELQTLWLELQAEATALAETEQLELEAGDVSGDLVPMRITRYGGFALRNAEGEYLRWRGGRSAPELIARQPKPGLAERVAGASVDGLIVDPTGGLLLGLQQSKPSLRERVAQGGIIGFVILGFGALGLVLGLAQWLYLLFVGAKVGRQLKQPAQAQLSNPLGRVLALRESGAGRDFSSLELAADEAVMREVPRLERLQDTVRLLAAVAPLLGLLGTVTGMIETFQAITLFGTGDPKLMAGGISQALMTTVLGLVVAVPLLFLHSLVVARSRSIVQVLDQQSAGLLAELREEQGAVLAPEAA